MNLDFTESLNCTEIVFFFASEMESNSTQTEDVEPTEKPVLITGLILAGSWNNVMMMMMVKTLMMIIVLIFL